MRKFVSGAGAAALLITGSVALSSPAVAVQFSFDDVADAAPIDIDGATITRDIHVSGVGEITDVSIMLDFSKVSDTCEAPGPWGASADEIGFLLTSPAGTTVRLINGSGSEPDDYEGYYWETYREYWELSTGRVQVTLDDAATEPIGINGLPETGLFTPESPLSAFSGESGEGTWVLTVEDSEEENSLCYFGATLFLADSSSETTETEVVPQPVAPVAEAPGTPIPPRTVETGL